MSGWGIAGAVLSPQPGLQYSVLRERTGTQHDCVFHIGKEPDLQAIDSQRPASFWRGMLALGCGYSGHDATDCQRPWGHKPRDHDDTQCPRNEDSDITVIPLGSSRFSVLR